MKFISPLSAEEIKQILNEKTKTKSQAYDGEMVCQWLSNNRFYLYPKTHGTFRRYVHFNYRVFWGKISSLSKGSLVQGMFFWKLKDFLISFFTYPLFLFIAYLIFTTKNTSYTFFDCLNRFTTLFIKIFPVQLIVLIPFALFQEGINQTFHSIKEETVRFIRTQFIYIITKTENEKTNDKEDSTNY